MTDKKTVYQMIAEVSAEMSKEGISKNNKNAQQGYKFRGIDDVYNALAPVMSKIGLVVLPRVLSRETLERQTKSGGTLFYTTVDVEFDFVSSHDGSKHVVKTYGEAMDSADKSTNKAMSAAYKYACMQAFCIPTEGDNDADATTHAVEGKRPPAKQPEKQLSPEEQEAYNKHRETVRLINEAVKNAKDEGTVITIRKVRSDDIEKLPDDMKSWLLGEIDKRQSELSTLNAG